VTGKDPQSLAIDPAGRFIYAANISSNDISAFSIDAATGALTEIPGSPFATGEWPYSVVIDPAGTHLYAAIYNANCVASYAIDQATGALSELAGSPAPGGNQPCATAIDPRGKFVYVTNTHNDGSNRTVSGYTVDAGTGALTEMDGSPFTVGWGPDGISVERTGKFVYVANNGTGDISAFSIDQTTGRLMPLGGSPFPVVQNPTYIMTVRIKQ
jgi:6-phosphogluconolactonase